MTAELSSPPPVTRKRGLNMAMRSKRRAKTPHTAKTSSAPRAKAKAISGKDPVRKSEPRNTTSSLLDAQLAFMQAAWAFHPANFMMRQQAILWKSLTTEPAASPSRKRAKR